ncbi:MAG: hypothetical protein JRF62_06905 [Deltaproteobacteria bacterium]|nr:hypothetical protein [Deltaproteobacteria bacterium]MBW2597657.1 hypothetical protein [Deltaproteobacteria bacterium]MBW2639895.1 hypothetical protein [Deltaproteobacteria bacterium]
MKGEVNRAQAHQSDGGLIPLYHSNVALATAQFRFDTPPACGGELHFDDISSSFQSGGPGISDVKQR